MKRVLLSWQLNNTFGWGILAYNLFSHWANDADLRPYVGHVVTDKDIELTDPLRLAAIIDALAESNQHLEQLQAQPTERVPFAGTVIDSLGNTRKPSKFHGNVNIGRLICEDTHLADPTGKLAKYDELLTASNWNAGLIEAKLGRRPKVIFEGVDTSLFCPGPRSGIVDSRRFHIFTGGKIEHRKAQDLVLLAFRAFAQRRPDARLVTSWHSPWPRMAAGFQGRLDRPLRLNREGGLDVLQWVADNGIDPSKVIDIGRIPNPMMPAVLREMDVALQPSRAEACTNLPVMEAMACGIPVIAAHNTGMKDLLAPDNSLSLMRQGPVAGVAGAGTEGWGESDVDEIVAALERAYTDREACRQIGRNAARFMTEERRSWRDHAAELKRFIASL